jgi:hypothetical protein
MLMQGYASANFLQAFRRAKILLRKYRRRFQGLDGLCENIASVSKGLTAFAKISQAFPRA